MSCIRLAVVLHLLAYGAMINKANTSSDQGLSSVLPAADKQLKDLLTKQIAADKDKSTKSDNFYDNFMQLDNMEIDIHNLTIDNFVGNIDTVEPNLANQYMQVNVEWSNLVIKGSCKVLNLEPVIPVRSAGNIEIKFSAPVAKAGINLLVEGNNLKTSFVNLNYVAKPDSVKVAFTEPSQDTSKVVSSLDTSVLDYIKGDLEWTLERALQHQLDQLLSGITLQDIFSKNADDAATYKTMNNETQSYILQVLHIYLPQLIQKVKDEKLELVHIPAQYVYIPGSVCDIELHLRKGTLRDVSTVRLVYDWVGYKYENGLYSVTLYVGLKVLHLFFKMEDSECGWIDISGKVRIKIPNGKNSVKLTITVKLIKRGDNIFALIKKVLILNVTVNNIDLVFNFDGYMAPTIDYFLHESITKRVKEAFEKELPQKVQPELDKRMPQEFPADELREGIDKNLLEVTEE